MPGRHRFWLLSACLGGGALGAVGSAVIPHIRNEEVAWYLPVLSGVASFLIAAAWAEVWEWGKWELPLGRVPEATPMRAYRNDLSRFRVTVFLAILIASPICAFSAGVTGYLLHKAVAAMSVAGPERQHVFIFGFATFGVAIGWLMPATRGGFGPAVQLIVVDLVVFVRTWGRDRTRFMRLLETARARQVLHQTGATYRFRHAELQDRLAADAPVTTVLPPTDIGVQPQPRPAPPPAPPGPRHMLADLLRGCAQNPTDGARARRLADEYLRLGMAPEAANAYTTAIALGEDTAASHRGLGDARRTAALPGVAAAYEAALRHDPDDVPTSLGLADWHLDEGDFVAARDRYRTCLDSHPTNVRALIGLGRAEAGLNRWTAAAEAFQRALAEDAENAAAWRGLGDACRGSLGDTRWSVFADAAALRRAAKAYRQALSYEPDDLWTLRQFAQAQRERGDALSAVEAYRRIVRITADADAYRAMGELYQAAGDFERAEAAYRDATIVSPDYFEDHYALGRILERRGSLERAYESLRTAEAIHDRHVPTYLDPTYLDHRMEQSRITSGIVDVLAAMVAEQQSTATYHELVRISPRLALLQIEIGDCWRKVGHTDWAVVAYRAALNIHDSGLAHRKLGEVLLETSEPERALGELRRSARSSDVPDGADRLIGEALMVLGRFGDAESAFRAAYESDPDPTIRRQLAEALRAQGRHDDANAIDPST